jgi:hypothetical protein
MEDKDEKEELPVHLILGSGEYSKIKTHSKPRIGKPGEPIAELTSYGWTLMSLGSETDLSNLEFARTSSEDYHKLCRLDVLGLEDKPVGDQQTVYQEFKDELVRSEEGWYETSLLWKEKDPDLPDNKQGSLARLDKLVERLQKKPELFKQYSEVIKDQEKQGTIEKAVEEPKGKEFYLYRIKQL